MWKTIDSTQSVVIIINTAVPYYIAGVAVAIGFKMNLFNIGSNGQYLLATLVAAWAGAEVSLPPVLHVPFVFLVAIAVGGTWALIAAILNVTRNVNVVVATIMLNYIAIGLVAFLLAEVFRDKENGGLVAQTKLMPESAQLPSLNGLFELFGFNFAPGVELFGFLPFAIALGVAYHILLNRSLFGYELRLSGLNPDAALSAGVNPKRMVLITLFMSGAVAGMIGLPFLLSDPSFLKYGDAFPTTIGFTGLGIALLGRNNPDRDRGSGDRVGHHRTGDPAPRPARHPAGDRQDHAGFVPARCGHRLRGGPPPQRRRRGRRRAAARHTTNHRRRGLAPIGATS